MAAARSLEMGRQVTATVVSSKKQTSQKITLVSTKLTDLKVLRNKVENSALLLGYQETYLKFELGSVVLQ